MLIVNGCFNFYLLNINTTFAIEKPFDDNL